MKRLFIEWFRKHAPAAMAGVLSAIALVSILFGLANQSAVDWISHTSQVQASLSALSNASVDALQAERMFLITRSEDQIVIRTGHLKRLMQALESTAQLVDDNRDQLQLVNELRTLIATRSATGQLLIDAHRAAVGVGEMIDPVTLRGHAELALLRAKIRDIETHEAKILEIRTKTAAFYLEALGITLGLGILVVATALWFWWRQSQYAIRILAESNSKLTESLLERSRIDDQIRHMQKMESIGQLTGGLAHDFNNMLAIVSASLTLAQKRLLKGTTNIAPLLNGALDGAQRAATLTNRLLAFSRLQPLAPETLNINRIIGGMSDMITRTIGDAVCVETVLAGGLWTTLVDVSQLENALLNLCVNARDAMPNGGSLTIETGNAHLDETYVRQTPELKAGQYVLIAVTDTGTGMTPEIIARAFDPFFTTKDVGKGSGMGLSQVFGFVKQSGGHLKIYSEVGQGTTIKIYLSRSFESESAGQVASKLQLAETRGMPHGNPRQIILVVEDEVGVRALTVMALRELGYTVIHAADADTALQQLDKHADINLLFTDIVMPGMNGRKLADEAVRRQPDLKVLFTTGFTRNAVVHGGVLDAGVNFIAKPFTIEQLAAKVSNVVG